LSNFNIDFKKEEQGAVNKKLDRLNLLYYNLKAKKRRILDSWIIPGKVHQNSIGGAKMEWIFWGILIWILLAVAISIGAAILVTFPEIRKMIGSCFRSFYRARRKARRRKREKKIPRAGAEIYISRPIAVAIWLFLAVLLMIGFWVASEALTSWVEGQLPFTLEPQRQEAILQAARWGPRGLGIVFLAIWFFRGCLKRVGSAARPAHGVIAFLGRPVDATGPGGLVFILGPFPEELWLLPTGQYEFDYRRKTGIYSQEVKKEERITLASQPLDIEVAIYLRWPRPDHLYTWIVEKDRAKAYKKPSVIPKVSEGLFPEGHEWRRVPGRELLGHLFLRFPRSLNLWDGADPERGIGPFLEKTIIGALRQALAKKDHRQFREEKQQIESDMKYYLILEPGNPLREWGIPPECLDIELTVTGFREAEIETEKAFINPELAWRNAEAASHQRIQAAELVEGYISKGVPPEIAAILTAVRIREEKELDLGVLRDLAILRYVSREGEEPARGRRRRP
jgi:hypothetical protein